MSAAYGGNPATLPGSIQAENYDNGGEGASYHSTTSTNAGGVYRSDGIGIAAISGGNYYVGWTSGGLAGDGINNLMKCALGIQAYTPGFQGHYLTGNVINSGSNYLSLTYTTPYPAPTGLTYIPEVTPVLVSGSFSNANTVLVSSSNSGGFQTISVRDTVPIGSTSSRFMRLRVTAP